MVLNIDFEGDMPIYVQIKQQIIQGIASGKLEKGESLPPVRQMGEDIGINLHTVNKAYNILKGEGYITVDRRIGAVISSKLPEKNEKFLEELNSELDFIIADSICRGVTKSEFLELCSQIFSKYEEAIKNE